MRLSIIKCLVKCYWLICLLSYSQISWAQLPICAYAVNQRSNNINCYTVNATSGQLTPTGKPVDSGGFSPSDAGSYNNNHFFYVLNEQSNEISLFKIDQSNCHLNFMHKVSTGIMPKRITFDISKRFAYVPNNLENTISQFSVDPDNGELRPLVPSKILAGGITPSSIKIEPQNKLAFVIYKSEATMAVFRIDQINGELSMIPNSKVKTGIGPMSPKFDNYGHILLPNYSENTISVYTYNADSGQVQFIHKISSHGAMPITGTFHPDGNHFYVSNIGSWNIALFNITANGNYEFIGLVESSFAAGPPVFDHYGHSYIASSNERLVRSYKVESNYFFTPLPLPPVTTEVTPYYFTYADPNLAVKYK